MWTGLSIATARIFGILHEALNCLLIETLSQYCYGELESRQKTFKKFTREHYKLTVAIEQFFNEYIKQLLDVDQKYDTLKANFRVKSSSSFGVKI